MHQQLSFSQIEYANQRKLTRRDRFLTNKVRYKGQKKNS